MSAEELPEGHEDLYEHQSPARWEAMLADLRRRYGPVEVPPCCVCGGRLGVQSIGGGPTVWACDGFASAEERERTGDRYAEGRSPADEHYSRSRWEDHYRGGDSRVIAVLERLAAVEARLSGALAQLQLVEEAIGPAWVAQAPSLAVAIQAKTRWLERLTTSDPSTDVLDVDGDGELIAARVVGEIVEEGLALTEPTGSEEG